MRNKRSLGKVLFLAEPKLSKALIDFRKASEEVQGIHLFPVRWESVWVLQDFVHHQQANYEQARKTIRRFIDHVTEAIGKNK